MGQESSISSYKAITTFMKGRACSDAVLHVLNEAFGYDLKQEEDSALSYAGGILQHGFQCGMVWGAVMAGGARVHELRGSNVDAEAVAVKVAGKLVDTFESQNPGVNCEDITEIDKDSSKFEMIKYFLLKGGSVSCFWMSGRYAPEALKDIRNILDGTPESISGETASCTAKLAEAVGASDLHKMIVSGFAGGIGLKGGACGALGAAVWFLGLDRLKEGEAKNLWDDDSFNTRFESMMESFLKATSYEFTCPAIAGKKFSGIQDHADFVCNGGCSAVITALADSIKKGKTEGQSGSA